MSDADDETFCSLCGHLLIWREVACKMDGAFIDYENRDGGEIHDMCFCPECWSKIREIVRGGLPRARKLWRELHLRGESE